MSDFRAHCSQQIARLPAEDQTPGPLAGERTRLAQHVHGVNLYACPSAVVDLGHDRHDLTWVSLKLTSVDILPKSPASSRPWRVHHLQACHGPPGVQLHLQASSEIRGPGKPLGSPPAHRQRADQGCLLCLLLEGQCGRTQTP